MTYNVFSWTLNPAQSINYPIPGPLKRGAKWLKADPV